MLAGLRQLEAGVRHVGRGQDHAGDVEVLPGYQVIEAVVAVRRGQVIIVVDDEDRENEGDLTIAAEKVTPEVINFMARCGRGLICLPMTAERLDELEIPLMVNENTSRFETAFTVPIEAKHVTSTGISAADRAATVHAAIDPATHPSDLARPAPGSSWWSVRTGRPDGSGN